MFVKFDFHIGAKDTEKRVWLMRLLDQVRDVIGKKHYSIRTEQAYIQWIKRYILFHKKRHPKYLREEEISEYLSYLATKGRVAASTQNQALNTIVFLYKQVLGIEVGELGETERAKKPERLPTVMTKRVQELLGHKDVSTTMIYTQVINKGGMGVRVPWIPCRDFGSPRGFDPEWGDNEPLMILTESEK